MRTVMLMTFVFQLAAGRPAEPSERFVWGTQPHAIHHRAPTPSHLPTALRCGPSHWPKNGNVRLVFNSYYLIAIWENRTKFRCFMNKIISDLFMAGICWVGVSYEGTFNACKLCVVLWYLPVLKIWLVTITAINFRIIGWNVPNFYEKTLKLLV
jgi:hypothetical protein